MPSKLCNLFQIIVLYTDTSIDQGGKNLSLNLIMNTKIQNSISVFLFCAHVMLLILGF